MNRFLGFIKKEFAHIFRDRRSMLILFGMPIAQILLFGYVVTNEIKDAHIAIYNPTPDISTNKIIDKLQASGYFIIVKNVNTQEEIEEVFKSGKAALVVSFCQDFEKKLYTGEKAGVQIIADGSEPNTAVILSNYAKGILFDFQQEFFSSAGNSPIISTEVRMLFNPELKSVYMFVPGTMALILMLISAMMTSISIAREKELGTMEVLLVSPLKTHQIILGKVSPYFLLSFINAVSIIALGYFVFDMPINGGLTFLMIESMLFILMALCLGIMISTLAKSQQVAMFISMFALLLPTMLLSGFIYPTENMPFILEGISRFIPPKYFIIILRGIMMKGIGLKYLLPETAVIIGFAIIFIAVSIRKFKLRLE